MLNLKLFGLRCFERAKFRNYRYAFTITGSKKRILSDVNDSKSISCAIQSFSHFLNIY